MKLQAQYLALIAALFVIPSVNAAEMPANPGMQMAHKATQAHKASGTVNKVDAANGTVNISHGPVASLGWMGMTMDFRVKDKALLKGIKPGQRVAFEIVRQADGSYAISAIAPAK